MKISIVIPTIGSPSTKIVKESLFSALASPSNIWSQIIIVNNSNDPEFTNFLEETTKDDKRVEILTIEEKLTMAESWNRGLEKVQEELVVFLHDDDILLSDNITAADIANIKGYKSFGFMVFGSETRNHISKDEGIKEICRNTPKLVSTVINTGALRTLGGWDNQSGYFLDFLAFVKIHIAFGSNISPKILGKYRLHSSNASSIAKRNRAYGDHLPYFLKEIFEIVTNEEDRRAILFAALSFTYPNNTTSKKIISRLPRLVGLSAWLK